MKNFMSILTSFFNKMFTWLNNKRNNFSEFIFKLKNTKVSKILLSNAFKSHQNSIVSFIFVTRKFLSLFELIERKKTFSRNTNANASIL